MRIYFAPLEGVTVYPFRMAHLSMFSDVDRYFLPFVSVHSSRSLKHKEEKDLIPAHNPAGKSVPQLIAHSAKDFLVYVRLLREFGYEEINLNLGCPSGTVVAKKKGAGFLAHPEELDAFFEEVFDHLDKHDPSLKLSVKTRIGISEGDAADELIRIYNRYPIAEVTVHPRYREQFYRGVPDMEVFDRFYEEIRHPLCYNGDIFSKEDAECILKKYPKLHAIMLGRGLIANPALARECKGGAPLNKEELRHFHDAVFESWSRELGDANNALHRMKELWDYFSWSFSDCEKYEKKIRKAKQSEEYERQVENLFLNCSLRMR